jgi:hypothetical protein
VNVTGFLNVSRPNHDSRMYGHTVALVKLEYELNMAALLGLGDGTL